MSDEKVVLGFAGHRVEKTLSLPDGELRFLIGPWAWLVIVYLYLPDEDRVIVVSAEDGREAAATIADERST